MWNKPRQAVHDADDVLANPTVHLIHHRKLWGDTLICQHEAETTEQQHCMIDFETEDFL